jgi:osmotically-inducible protein OsmY
MLHRGLVPDKAILKKINQRLQRTGLGSGCRLSALVRNGQVTLSGSIQYEHQRRSALRAVNGVEGVRGVTDQLQVPARTERRM